MSFHVCRVGLTLIERGKDARPAADALVETLQVVFLVLVILFPELVFVFVD